MPIEPIDNPYRVIHSERSQRTRRVERHDPEEHQEKNQSGEFPQDTFTSESEPEEKKEEKTEELHVKKDVKQKPPNEDESKAKLDIRI